MAIAAGTRFGPYQIVAPLGTGGMGEVHRAIDVRLGRTVALKVLAADTTHDPVARERFEREAALIAQLQHPHICVLHDVGHEGNTPYLVMELLDGETLDARLRRGPLRPDDALAIGAQVAHALDAAHRHGIVHRDLKPANVMLVKSLGNSTAVDVKLLDFGVAKLLASPRAGADDTAAAGVAGDTTAAVLTQSHHLVGTLPYMAPEQLAGQSADARTDLWALGCVLYEMMSGTRPFAAQTTGSLMAAILERPSPPLADRVPSTPPSVGHLVARCLEKDPERRWQTARDVALELDWARTREPEAAVASPKRSSFLPFLAGCAVAAGVATVVAWAMFDRRGVDLPSPPVVRLAVPAPDDTHFLGGRAAPYVALSPDARRLAFVPTPFRRSSGLWVRDLDSGTARTLAGTAGATYPFWSSDGSRIAFFADGKLKVVDPRGGRPLTLCDAPASRGGTWNQFDDILFTPTLDGGLYKIAASGGTPMAVTTLDPARTEINHKLPSFLPDGRHFVFVNQTSSPAHIGLYVGSIDSSESSRLLDVVSKAQYADGFLWYIKDGTLVAHGFDPTTYRLTGAPRPVGDDVAGRNTIIGDATFSIANDGTAVVWNGPLAATTELAWYDRTGRRVRVTGTPDRYFSLALAPDDRTIAVEMPDPEGPYYNIWTIDDSTGVKSRLTSGSLNWGPVWSPDGERIAYGSVRGGPSQVFERGLNGSPPETGVWKSGDFIGPTGWLPSGESLVLLDVTHYRLGLSSRSPSAAPTWISNDAFVEGDGRVSPDGRWLAYTSNEAGTWDVYLRSFPSLERKIRVSPAGGSGPLWRRDSAELFYIDPDQHLMAVAIGAGSTPITGPPTRLFALPIVPTPPGIDPRLMYAATSNGDRFLVNATADVPSPSPLTVVLNLADNLRNDPR